MRVVKWQNGRPMVNGLPAEDEIPTHDDIDTWHDRNDLGSLYLWCQIMREMIIFQGKEDASATKG